MLTLQPRYFIFDPENEDDIFARYLLYCNCINCYVHVEARRHVDFFIGVGVGD